MIDPELAAREGALWVSGPDFDYGTDGAGYYEDHHDLFVTGRFEVEVVHGVTLEVASLGYRVVYLNGCRVSDDVLAGEWTRFDKLVYCDR